MKIVIIGDGKVGHKLTIQLSEENYDVVLIDQNEGKLKEALNQLDILCITGDGADAKVQKEAGVPGADLVVACASTDELNMLSCLLAKRLGAKHTIARTIPTSLSKHQLCQQWLPQLIKSRFHRAKTHLPGIIFYLRY